MLLSKKSIALVMSFSFIFTSGLGILENKAFAINNSKDELQQNKYKYSQAMASDLSLAQEDKIIEMLKNEGKLRKEAGYEESQKAYVQYMNELRLNNKVQAETKEVEELLENDMNNPENNAFNKKTLRKNVKEVNVLAVMVEYSDYKHNQIQLGETNMYYKDYSREHYQNMLFSENGYKGPNGENLISMTQYYNEQSGGSLKVTGEVTKWYTANKTAKYYGEEGKGVNDTRPRELVQDALAELSKDPSIDLSKYDKYDRYDIDADGNYNEPDGIIDYLLLIHAGLGQEAGGGSLGSDAIWSHRSNLGDIYKIPGTNYSAFDYIINPEDGATGVFAHEFAHDLGVPDEYDTMYSSSTNSPVGSWSLMASGSWAGKIPGTEPTGISPYCKEILQKIHGGNWQSQTVINYNELSYGGKDIKIGQANEAGEVIKINLPEIETVINKPTSGTYSYWSGKGRNETNFSTSMSKSLDLANTTNPTLNFKTWYDIEEGYDFAAVQVKTPGETVWKDIKGNITTTEKAVGVNSEIINGITGNSKGWVDGKFDLSEYAGKQIDLRVVYSTDVAVYGEGIYIDDIIINDGEKEIFSDNVEGNKSFELKGFSENTGINKDKNYYLIEWRNLAGVDKGLKYIDNMYSYNPGMVVWYVNEKYNDNWTGVHPGAGFLSVIDADQVNSYVVRTGLDISTHTYLNSKVQMHDAAFSNNKSNTFKYNIQNTIYNQKITICDDSNKINTVFRDYDYYTNKELPTIGTKLPELGVQVKIVSQESDNSGAVLNVGLN